MRFEMNCEANAIEHHLIKRNKPCTNDHFERINRTIKEATAKRHYYEGHDRLRTHLAIFTAN